MRKFILLASVAFASGILFVNIFNSIVNAVAYESNIPDSIIATRQFFKTVNPGTFFQIFSPATQVLALLALIIYWKKVPVSRSYLGIAFLFYLAADIFTFIYFHPRNDIMFLSEPLPDTQILKRLASEWSSMNWVRSLVVFMGLVFSFVGVDKIYTFRNPIR
ncbi:DUF1772 domain-containing protein [Flavobacterium sp. ACN6]|uniref:DUF1772 domain-containing protein n=1 Tax=Flavobacterium sp. ACN6 TaxID=1920426 RepID=UPI000BB39EA4|nr:DUF1772 domain-containing protein [Flavobacterium sp. ACN6]PBJ10215.1 hypothetical protein BSF42_32840 [Flavobacterium sp. ACN6]